MMWGLQVIVESESHSYVSAFTSNCCSEAAYVAPPTQNRCFCASKRGFQPGKERSADKHPPLVPPHVGQPCANPIVANQKKCSQRGFGAPREHWNHAPDSGRKRSRWGICEHMRAREHCEHLPQVTCACHGPS